MAKSPNPPMNRKRVIIWMTVAVAIILLTMTVVLLGALPPWPVWLFFGLSHAFFCTMIWKTKPYSGPFKEPMEDIIAPSDS
ncbi:MAG: hypothetical protein RIC29_12655 [Rhodospirillaceae bacterium]